MIEKIIESVLTGKLDSQLLIKWLNNELTEDSAEDCLLYCCNRNEFVAYFLSYLRNQTDSILQTNGNALPILQNPSTPEKMLSSRRKHRRSISDPTSETDRTMDSLTVKTDRHRSHESPSKDRKKSGRKVKTKLFPEDRKDQSVSSDESRLSAGFDRLGLSSTPMKNGLKLSEYCNTTPTSPVPHSRSFNRDHDRCDTPRLNHRHSRSQDKSISFGDYLVNAQTKSSKKKKGKNVSNEAESDSKIELDLSNSDIFPEIGARKSNSLRSEKRRIKPTNIDSTSQKSFSLINFSPECFQQPSPLVLEENLAFKHQKLQPKELANSFEVERNILKQERHKLMEKFNILNMSSSPKAPATPQIKIISKDSVEKTQNFIKADVNKILLKGKLDILIDIYDILLRNNLILSINTEIYFLISILLSKQDEDDCINSESQMSDNYSNYLLKTIHNSTYFSVKSLWNQRTVLEVILDKNSLKILGENKRVRSFFPDLAKFLLNSYGLKCEAESQDRRGALEARSSNGIVCFNLETDNAENFPSVLSFQNFKKQRDMFYEIIRWYQETVRAGGGRGALRARVKALVASGPNAANHAHLASLFAAHALAECLPPPAQESKLSKLQRRLTCPAAPESHRLPHFTPEETFYKEFIMHAENESFRVHLRHALASEISVLDSTPIATEDNRSPNNLDISKEYLQLSKKLRLLAKFLGYVTSLPYSQVSSESTLKTGAVVGQREQNYNAPKEKVLENNIALRNYSQPCIDLKGMLATASQTNRLSITLPWIVHYLSMLDYTSLRINYYQELLKNIFDIYVNNLRLNSENMRKNTVIYLKSILGWLFDLPHFPQDLFYERSVTSVVGSASDVNIDGYDFIDESVLFELCPHLKEVNVLLSTCKVTHDQKDMGSFRHITPVCLSLNVEDRIRNKEKELQSRLEEELLKSQPSSTRRVLELVIERVTSGAVREVSAHALTEARQQAREHARRLVRLNGGEDTAALLQTLQGVYSEQLQRLRCDALTAARASIQRRTSGALAALLPAAPKPLHALAARGCLSRLTKWLNDNWNTTAILCKDIEAEMKTLLALGEMSPSVGHKSGAEVERPTLAAAHLHALHASPAAALINLKEQICLLLEYEEVGDVSPLVAACAASCSPSNALARPPARRALLQLSVDLCVVYVSRKPQDINEIFLNKLNSIWSACCPDRKKRSPPPLDLPERRESLSPKLRNFEDDDRAPTPVSDDEDSKEPKDSSSKEEKPKDVKEIKNKTDVEESNDESLEFFDRILSPRNIVLLSTTKCKPSDVWEALATVLVYLLKNNYLSEDSLTEQCLAVYRQDWPQSILENLSTCMKSVSSRWSRSSTGKFTLFLDFLSEYCGDMDYEPLDHP